jgi:hypothetical protein
LRSIAKKKRGSAGWVQWPKNTLCMIRPGSRAKQPGKAARNQKPANIDAQHRFAMGRKRGITVKTWSRTAKGAASSGASAITERQ